MATKAVSWSPQAKAWEIRDAVWSPDSKWIAYSQEEPDGLAQRLPLFPGSEQDLRRHRSAGTVPTVPHFSGDGKYLFFVSNSDFNPIYSDTEWNHTYSDMARIYLVTLAK